jgi:gas vesicle protein
MMKNFGSFLFGLMTGAVIGGGLALLMAPSSGDDTRGRLQESYSHIRNEVKDAAVTKANDLKAELARLQKKVLPE